MFRHAIGAVALCLAGALAFAQSEPGPVGGAIVGGPVGAGVGAVAGGALSSSSEQDQVYVRQ
jgi:hypothetical protein